MMNWPSAPIFHKRMRKAIEHARLVNRIGVALTIVSESTPILPNEASGNMGVRAERIAASEGDHDAADDQGDNDCSKDNSSREPAWWLAQARFELDAVGKALWP